MSGLVEELCQKDFRKPQLSGEMMPLESVESEPYKTIMLDKWGVTIQSREI